MFCGLVCLIFGVSFSHLLSFEIFPGIFRPNPYLQGKHTLKYCQVSKLHLVGVKMTEAIQVKQKEILFIKLQNLHI